MRSRPLESKLSSGTCACKSVYRGTAAPRITRSQSKFAFSSAPRTHPLLRPLFLIFLWLIAEVQVTVAIEIRLTKWNRTGDFVPGEFATRSDLDLPFTGFVEVRPSATAPWGTVCSNGLKQGKRVLVTDPLTGRQYYAHEDDSGVVDVICSQLGFGNFRGHSRLIYTGFHPNITVDEYVREVRSFSSLDDIYPDTEGGVPIYFDGLDCSQEVTRARSKGERWTLEGCSALTRDGKRVSPPPTTAEFISDSSGTLVRRPLTRCLHSDDSVVQCVIPPSSYEFKLANATTGFDGAKSSGLVLMRPLPNLPWGTISASSFMSPIRASFTTDADYARARLTVRENLFLMCKALGFPRPSAPRYRFSWSLDHSSLSSDTTLITMKESLFPQNDWLEGEPRWSPPGIHGPLYVRSFNCIPAHNDIRECGLELQPPLGSTRGLTQLGIACDEAEMPTSVELVNGVNPFVGQVVMKFPFNSESFYNFFLPRRIVLGSSTTRSEQVANTLLLRALCTLAGFSNATKPKFRFIGKHVHPSLHAEPVPWVELSGCRSAMPSGGGVNLSDCRPVSNRSFRSYLEPTTSEGNDIFGGDSFYPVGVDCFPSTVSPDEWEVRLINSTLFRVSDGSALNGIVQIRSKRSLSSSSWGYILDDARQNNFPLWVTLCSSVGFHPNDTVVTRVRDLSEFTKDNNFADDSLHSFAPIVFDGATCPTSFISPRYRFESTVLHTRNQFLELGRCIPKMTKHTAMSSYSNVLALDCRPSSKIGINWPEYTPVLEYSSILGGGPNAKMVSAVGLVTVRALSTALDHFVCTNDTNALLVLCRAAGYSIANQTVRYVPLKDKDALYENAEEGGGSTSRPTNRLFLYHNLTCEKNASQFDSCGYDYFVSDYCPLNQIASVDCFSLPPISRWDFRLYPPSNSVAGQNKTIRGELQIRPWRAAGDVNSNTGDWWSVPIGEAVRREVDVRTMTYSQRKRWQSNMLGVVQPAAYFICIFLGFTDPRNAVTYNASQEAGVIGVSKRVLISDISCEHEAMSISDCVVSPATAPSSYSVLGIDCDPKIESRAEDWKFVGVPQEEPLANGHITQFFRIEVVNAVKGVQLPLRYRPDSPYETDVFVATAACRSIGKYRYDRPSSLYFPESWFVFAEERGVVAVRSCGANVSSLSECLLTPHDTVLTNRSSSSSKGDNLFVSCDYTPPPRARLQIIIQTSPRASANSLTKGYVYIGDASRSFWPLSSDAFGRIVPQEIVNAICASAGLNYTDFVEKSRLANQTAPQPRITQREPWWPHAGRVSTLSNFELGIPSCSGREGERLETCQFARQFTSTPSPSQEPLAIDCRPTDAVEYGDLKYRINEDELAKRSPLGQLEGRGHLEIRSADDPTWAPFRLGFKCTESPAQLEALRVVARAACRTTGRPSAGAFAFCYPRLDVRTTVGWAANNTWRCPTHDAILPDCFSRANKSIFLIQHTSIEIAGALDLLHIDCNMSNGNSPSVPRAELSEISVRMETSTATSLAVGVPYMQAVSPSRSNVTVNGVGIGGGWGHLCGYGNDFDSSSAEFVCSKLGFPFAYVVVQRDVVLADGSAQTRKTYRVPNHTAALFTPSIHVLSAPFFFPAADVPESEGLDVARRMSGRKAMFDAFSLDGDAALSAFNSSMFDTDSYRSLLRYVYPVWYPSCEGHEKAVAVVCRPQNTYMFSLSQFEYNVTRISPETHPNRVWVRVRPSNDSIWGHVSGYPLNFTDNGAPSLDSGSRKKTLNVYTTVCKMAGFKGDGRLAIHNLPSRSELRPGPRYHSGYSCPDNTTHLSMCVLESDEPLGSPYSSTAHILIVDCDFPSLASSKDQWELRIDENAVLRHPFFVRFLGGQTRRGLGLLQMRPTPTSPWGTVGGHVEPQMACEAAGYIQPSPTSAIIAVLPAISRAYPEDVRWVRFNCSYSRPANTPLMEEFVFNGSRTVTDCSEALGEVSEFSHVNTADMMTPHNDDIWIECYPELRVELTRGSTPAEGLVRLSVGLFPRNRDSWLCNDGFDRDANAQRAVCRAAGLRNTRQTRPAMIGPGVPSGGVGVTDLRCPFNAWSLAECTYSASSRSRISHQCFPVEQTGVKCFDEVTTSVSVTFTENTLKTSTKTPWWMTPDQRAASPTLRSLSLTKVHRPTVTFTADPTLTFAGTGSVADLSITWTSTLSTRQTLSGKISPTPDVSSTLTLIPIPPPVLVQPVPEAVTATVTTAVGVVGGVGAASDAQAMAIVGLVDCGANGVDTRDDSVKQRPKGYRSISPFALEDSCRGVLAGNFIALGLAATVNVVTFLVAGLCLEHVTSYRSALSFARAPHLFFIVAAMVHNSFCVCGTALLRSETYADGGQDGDAALGIFSWFVAVVIACSYPLTAFLFCSRRLEFIEYHWPQHPFRQMTAEIFLPTTQLDADYPCVNAFGTVIGSYQRLRAGWTLTALFSTAATVPLIFAEHHTCVPLFAVSAALFFAFAGIIFVCRPKRTLALDVLHGLMLAGNGALMGVSAALLLSPGTFVLELASSWVGTLLTALTVVRTVVSFAALAVKVLISKEKITNVRLRSGAQERRRIQNGNTAARGVQSGGRATPDLPFATEDLDIELLPLRSPRAEAGDNHMYVDAAILASAAKLKGGRKEWAGERGEKENNFPALASVLHDKRTGSLVITQERNVDELGLDDNSDDLDLLHPLAQLDTALASSDGAITGEMNQSSQERTTREETNTIPNLTSLTSVNGCEERSQHLHRNNNNNRSSEDSCRQQAAVGLPPHLECLKNFKATESTPLAGVHYLFSARKQNSRGLNSGLLDGDNNNTTTVADGSLPFSDSSKGRTLHHNQSLPFRLRLQALLFGPSPVDYEYVSFLWPLKRTEEEDDIERSGRGGFIRGFIDALLHLGSNGSGSLTLVEKRTRGGHAEEEEEEEYNQSQLAMEAIEEVSINAFGVDQDETDGTARVSHEQNSAVDGQKEPPIDDHNLSSTSHRSRSPSAASPDFTPSRSQNKPFGFGSSNYSFGGRPPPLGIGDSFFSLGPSTAPSSANGSFHKRQKRETETAEGRPGDLPASNTISGASGGASSPRSSTWVSKGGEDLSLAVLDNTSIYSDNSRFIAQIALEQADRRLRESRGERR